MRKLLTFLFLSLVLVPAGGPSWAASLQWDAVTTCMDGSSCIPAGYKIYRGTSPGSYSVIVDVGNVLSWIIPALSPGTWYFSATAYLSSSNESAKSNEVSYLQGGEIVIAAATNVVVTITENSTPPPTENIEAESGVIVSPMQKVADPNASGGYYIRTQTDEQGTATFQVNVVEAGTYKIIARCYATNAGNDSFYVKVDSLAEDTWDFNPQNISSFYNVWLEDEVTKRGTGTFDHPQYDPYTFPLTAGIHVIVFRGRESGARLDYFRLVKVQ